MAEHEIKVVIGAKDEASKQIKAIDKDLVALTKKKALIEVDADADAAQKQLDELDKQIAELQGEKAQIIVEAKVDRAVAALEEVAVEAKKAETAAEALSVALGPELAGTADLDGIIADFQRMGLSLDEITANADRLGATLRDVGSRDVGGQLTTGFSRIDESAKSAGSSASVLANAVGNTAQDLGALGGVAGTAGVALGQMGEYMSEAALSGEGFASVVKNFAKVGAPIAALAIVMQLVSQRAKEAQERTEDFTETVEDLAAASDKAFDAQAMELWAKMFFRVALDGKDFNDQLKDMATNNTAVARRILAHADAIGINAEQQRLLAQAISDVESEEYNAARTERLYGDAVKASTENHERAADAQERRRQAFEDHREAVEEAIAKEKEFALSVHESGLELLDAEAASEAFGEALDKLNRASELDFSTMALDTVDSFDDIKEALKKADEVVTDWSKVDLTPDSVDELRGIPDELAAVTRSISGMRGSIQTELQAAFDSGGIDAFVAKAQFFRGEILDQFPAVFRSMGAGPQEAIDKTNELLGALGLLPEDIEITIRLNDLEQKKRALETFGDVIAGLTEPKQIEINTLIAQGDIDAAFNLLNTELINRGYPPIQIGTATVPPSQANIDATMRAAQTALNRRPLDVPLQGRWVHEMGNSLFDAGGTVPAAGGIVAERRPEIINGRFLVTSPSVVPPGTRVTGGAKTARILRTRGTRGLRRFDSGGVVPSGPVTVNFNGVGAIGNRYDLMRTVQRANLDKQRLLGSRG